jgi:2-hydroxy-6-oxonona-2,4-dienedioate hydrolase
MKHLLKKENNYNYIEVGEGTPIIVLHGLMGGLSNFDSVTHFFSENGYKVLIPELPIYSMSLLKTNVKNFAIYLKEFIDHKGYDEVILLGNSLGGPYWLIPHQNVS